MSLAICREEDVRSCGYSTNSAQLHDDPFTSSPAELTWFCQYPGRDWCWDGCPKTSEFLKKKCDERAERLKGQG